jgi:altronate dehydratase large subunit
MKFLGYRRPDGRVGVRNHIAVIPSVVCANKAAEVIAKQVEGAVAMRHPLGCGQVGADLDLTARTLIAMGNHPNVAAVVVVGLGCERFKPTELYEGIRETGKPVSMVVIQEEGDTLKTIEKGVRMGKEFASQFLQQQRVECDISELIVALKCGGTDATSGIAANPALGQMSDLLVDMGGSVILSELNELLGTEDMLAQRAVDQEVANRVYEVIYGLEERLRVASGDERYASRGALISPGNFDGGVSSIVEKALGGVHKSGSRPIVEVLDYASAPKSGRKGVYLLDSPSHDGEVVTGMIGAGAQIVTFTSGRGTPVGHPLAPVIKITGNDFTYDKMKENIDFNAGDVISKGASLDQKGKQLLELVLEISNGKRTKAELLGHDELFCITRLPF